MFDYNAETLNAIQEALDIESGKTQAKHYSTVDELFAENDEEITTENLSTIY